MNKIKKLFALVCLFLGLFVVAACNDSKSGVTVEMDYKTTATKVIFSLTFAENEKLSDGTAKPHIKQYAYDEETKGAGAYQNKDESVSFSNGVYTSSTVTFSGLDKDTQYVYRLYVTYNKNEELIQEITVKTLNTGTDETVPTEIKTVEDFNAMGDAPDGYYKLVEDLDFKGAKISSIFTSTSTKQFTGVFDGNGHSISNFVLDSANTGLFGYCTDATIKDLTIIGTSDATQETPYVNGDYSSGRSTANVGIVCGTATNTLFQNITMKNVAMTIQGNTSAEINAGIVCGSAENCAFDNVKVTGASLTLTRCRLKVRAGLFAGFVNGDAKKVGEDSFTAKNCMIDGKFNATLYYPSSEGFSYLGGFIGALGSTGVIESCYTVCDMTIDRNATESDSNKFDLCAGGFVGTNPIGKMRIIDCAAVADINVYAGKASDSLEDQATLATKAIGTKTVYVGGFAGKTNIFINVIKNSTYVEKSTGLHVYAKEVNDKNETIFYKDNIVAYNADSQSKIDNVVLNDTSVLSEAMKTAVDAYKK